MSKIPVVFFGNEKLATGIPQPKPFILEAVKNAGFEIEQHVTGKLSDLKPHRAKIAVLAAYGRIIPQRVIDEFPLGIINVHPSLLPRHRGPTPIEQTILDGDTKTGVSIMQISAGMDEGPIYKQRTMHLHGNESKSELTSALHELGANLISEILPLIASGDIKPRSQPHPSRASYSRKISKTDGLIDWKKPAKIIEREIRAYADWPRSYGKLADIDVIITSAEVINNRGKSSSGQIVVDNKTLMIATNEGWLQISCLQIPGKKEMTAEAFLAGYKSKLI